MVLLWRDPEGNTITVTAGNNSIPTQNSCSEQMQIIASLKNSVGEKDHLIAKLKNEISALKEVSFFFYVMMIVRYSYGLHSHRVQLVKSVKMIEGIWTASYLCEQ